MLNEKNRKSLAGFLAPVLAILISASSPLSANSTQIRKVDFGKDLKIVHSATFKLPKTGCAKIRFKYDASVDVVEEGSFVIDIFSDDLDLVGSTTWYGEMTSAIERTGRSKGSTFVEVCRKPWYDENQDLEFVGATRGDFEVRIALEGVSSDYRSSKIRLT